VKVGDTVKKVVGRDIGSTGIIDSIQYNANGSLVLSVITNELYGNRHAVSEPYAQSNMGGINTRSRNWVANDCEVVDERW
jgi:hypothetical protein